jgi:hypothetical protein
MRGLNAAETKSMRRTDEYILLRNKDILEEIKSGLVKKKLAQYKQNSLNIFSRMQDIRYPE